MRLPLTKSRLLEYIPMAVQQQFQDIVSMEFLMELIIPIPLQQPMENSLQVLL